RFYAANVGKGVHRGPRLLARKSSRAAIRRLSPRRVAALREHDWPANRRVPREVAAGRRESRLWGTGKAFRHRSLAALGTTVVGYEAQGRAARGAHAAYTARDSRRADQ